MMKVKLAPVLFSFCLISVFIVNNYLIPLTVCEGILALQLT